jgi:hypothetical protein
MLMLDQQWVLPLTVCQLVVLAMSLLVQEWELLLLGMP